MVLKHNTYANANKMNIVMMMMPFTTNRNNNSNSNQIRRSTTNKMKMKMMKMTKKKKISDDDNNDNDSSSSSSNSSSVTTDTDTDFSEKTHDGETETIKLMKKKKNKNKVRFSTVHIREYNVCLGDNPSVSQGPPISLDWYYDNETWYDIDDHEKQKQGRGGAPCCVPPKERLNLLKQIGYSQKELTEAIRRVEKSKKQHFRTRKWLQKTDLIRSFF
mmetsp:Transcript_65347/g.73169  ORF Transcript_65347/g.73169 Transcript_65347/m.73169 type:complete len:217 (-) Transcript_65347:726-1376(-)